MTLSAAEMGVPTYLPSLTHLQLFVLSVALTHLSSLWIPCLTLDVGQFICGTLTTRELLGGNGWLNMVKLR